MPSRTTKTKPTAFAAPDWDFLELLLAAHAVRILYIYGPPGIGKSFSAYTYGRTDNGVYPVTLTQETPASELRGHYVPKGDELAWQDGPFTSAMRNGGRLVINEIGHANADVLALLFGVLESEETAQMMMPNGVIVRPEKDFHVIMTDNEPPDDLPFALQDRFDAELHITQPHPAALARLEPRLRRAAERAFELDEDRRVSLRKWITLQRLQDVMGLEKACVAVFGSARGAKVYEAIMVADGA